MLQGYDPLSAADVRDPYPELARARAEAPVFFDEKYGFWNITRQADVLEVLRDEVTFSSKSAIPMPLPPEDMREELPVYPFESALVFMDDPEHRRNRRMLQGPFIPRRLKAREQFIRDRASQLMQEALPKGRMDFLSEFALPLALTVIGDLVGVPEEDWPLLERSINDAFSITKIHAGVVNDDTEIRRLAEGQLEYWRYLCRLVEERRANPIDDFSSLLSAEVDPEDGTRLTVDETAGLINTVLGAGFHTSAQLMTAGVFAILSHPDQWELLKSDRSLLPKAVEECARYRTPVKRIYRHLTRDAVIGGVEVPKGALVALVLASCNRDEDVFEDVDEFDITRAQSNLTFGRGMHHCLGAPLSKTEMSIALETLLDHAPKARLAVGEPIVRPVDLRLDTLEVLHIEFD